MPADREKRLLAYYQWYAPELASPQKVRNVLRKFDGRESELEQKLAAKYEGRLSGNVAATAMHHRLLPP